MKKRLLIVVVLGFVVAGCGGETTASVPCPVGEALDNVNGEVCVPLDLSAESPVSSSTSTTSTTTTTSTVPESATEQVETSPVVTDGEVPNELTWAEDGTDEAAVEQAFWNGNVASKEIYTEDILDPNYAPFVETHTGRDLERIQTEVAELAARGGVFFRYPEPSETKIEFISLVTPTEALVQVCELERSEYYTDGELNDGRDFDSEFQARFVLVDGVWLWEETIKLKFEPLVGEQPTCMTDLDT